MADDMKRCREKKTHLDVILSLLHRLSSLLEFPQWSLVLAVIFLQIAIIIITRPVLASNVINSLIVFLEDLALFLVNCTRVPRLALFRRLSEKSTTYETE